MLLWIGLPAAVIRLKARMEMHRQSQDPERFGDVPPPIRALFAKIEDIGGTVERLEAIEERKDKGTLN